MFERRATPSRIEQKPPIDAASLPVLLEVADINADPLRAENNAFFEIAEL
jgi:hypothetical protein